MDLNRIEQFKETKRRYDEMPQAKEFIIPTRSPELEKKLNKLGLLKDARVILYEHKIGFNPSKALNIGLREAKYDQIIVTSPEVMPKTNVLEQLGTLKGRNVVCQVFDQKEDGDASFSLVNKSYRADTPAMYFLAMFNKSDLEKINGWDEDFMLGYAYEDNDFGNRWVRAGLPFEVCNEIQGIHQFHPRSETIHGGSAINFEKMNWNTDNKVSVCKNGLLKL